MKIGLVIYGSLDTLSGGYLYDRKLVEYLRSQGDTVEIISLPWQNYAAHLIDNFHFRLPIDFDVLIQDELNHPSLIFANRGRHPYPVIALVHHLRCSELRSKWQNIFYQVIEKEYLQSADGFIFNSSTTERAANRLIENRLVENRLVESRKPSVVAYPPTDQFGEPISEEEIVSRAQIAPLRIVFLGNVIERKGLHTLLKAVSVQPLAMSDQQLAVRSQPSAFRVDVIGSLTSEPEYARQIQQFITDNHLSSFVFLHGSLDQEALAEKLRQSHVLVVPSSYEGFGIVYLEGMCFGLPAIGTTAGAAGEIIEAGQTGYLIEPGDSASLAAYLQALVEDRGLLTRLSLNARQRYLRQPAWPETAESIRNFLYSITNRYNGSNHG